MRRNLLRTVVSIIGLAVVGAAAVPVDAAQASKARKVSDAQLVALLDRVTIEDMMYGIYHDLTQYQKARNAIDSHFLPDAVMIVNGLVLQGRQKIHDAYSSRQNENVRDGMTLNMIAGNPRIKVNGDEANVELVWTGILNEGLKEMPKLLQQGTDHTNLVKVGGEWKIKHRVITSQSNMPKAWDGD
jgi:SnoaL-like domain